MFKSYNLSKKSDFSGLISVIFAAIALAIPLKIYFINPKNSSFLNSKTKFKYILVTKIVKKYPYCPGIFLIHPQYFSAYAQI